MPRIHVLQPFVLRIGQTRVVYDVGVHEISEADLGHWFVQACIKDGRAVPLVVDEGESLKEGAMSPDELKPGDEVIVPGREDYEALTVAQLSELAANIGVAIPPKAKKSEIIDLLLKDETHAGKTLVVADNGDLVEKD
jgi:hypothetical protein